MAIPGASTNVTIGASSHPLKSATPSPHNTPTSIGALGILGLRTDRVVVGKLEVQSISLALVDRVVIENSDVQLPFLEVIRSDKGDS